MSCLPGAVVKAVSRSFLCLFASSLDGDPDEIGWVRLMPLAAAARLICLLILLSSIRRLYFKPLSAVGRSWLGVGSAGFPRRVSEAEGRYEAAESWAQDWRGSRAMHALFCNCGRHCLRSFSGERSLLLFVVIIIISINIVVAPTIIIVVGESCCDVWHYGIECCHCHCRDFEGRFEFSWGVINSLLEFGEYCGTYGAAIEGVCGEAGVLCHAQLYATLGGTLRPPCPLTLASWSSSADTML